MLKFLLDNVYPFIKGWESALGFIIVAFIVAAGAFAHYRLWKEKRQAADKAQQRRYKITGVIILVLALNPITLQLTFLLIGLSLLDPSSGIEGNVIGFTILMLWVFMVSAGLKYLISSRASNK